MSKRILVVDDEFGLADLVASLLRDSGYEVTLAINGRLGLARLSEQTPDLVLLDVMMPVLDGVATLARLKADERLRHVPVVMISAVSDIDRVARCIELGAEDYLPKPFN